MNSSFPAFNGDSLHQFQQSLDQLNTMVAHAGQKMQTSFLAVNDPLEVLARSLSRDGGNSIQGGLKTLGEQFGTLRTEGRQSFQDLGRSARSFHAGFAETLGRMVATGKLQFNQLFSALAQDVSKILVYHSITKPLTGFVSSLFGGGLGGSLGSSIGKLVLSAIPGRAAGGPVLAGSPYVVGENGPELFVPKTSGQILPSTRMDLSGAALAPVSVSNHWTIVANDTRGFDDLLASRRRMIEAWSVAGVQKAFNKRGRHGPLDAGRT